MIDPGTALGAGASVIGAVTGKKKKSGTSASRATQSLLEEAIRRQRAYNPETELNIALTQASKDAEKAITRATSNVFSQYAQQGSLPYLPDTARNSVIRGAVSDIAEKLATYEAEQRSNMFSKWLQPALAIVNSASAGKGEVLQNNNNFNAANSVPLFSKLLSDAFKKG